MKEIVNGSFCHKYEYIKNIGLDRWKKIDEFYHELGKRLGYDEDTINDSAYEFIDIYMLIIRNIRSLMNIWLVWQR